MGSAAADRNVLTFGPAHVQLTRAGNLQIWVLDHLAPLGDPARQPPEGEQDGEHLGGESHGPVDQPGVEVHVRVQLALDEVVVRERQLLQLEGDVEQLVTVTETSCSTSPSSWSSWRSRTTTSSSASCTRTWTSTPG